MKYLLLAIAFVSLGAGKPVAKSCVEFTKEIPKFSDSDLKVIDEYLPQIVDWRPRAIVASYLFEIEKNESGFKFIFNSLSHLRSHSCPEFTSVVSDGQHSYQIDLKNGIIILNSMVISQNGKSIKIKK